MWEVEISDCDFDDRIGQMSGDVTVRNVSGLVCL